MDLHVETRGNGPAVLWIRGYTMDSTLWRPVWDLLPGFRHVGVDLPGHGRSGPLLPGETLPGLATRMAEVAKAHQASRVVALSFGSCVALEVAASHPGVVGRLALAAPNPACSAWRTRAVAALSGLGRKPEARALAESEVALARAWGAPGPLGRALVGYASVHEGTVRLDLLGEAVAVLEGSGCELNLARALIRLGTELHVAGHARAARDALERGLSLADECGAETLTAVAHRACTRPAPGRAGSRPRPP